MKFVKGAAAAATAIALLATPVVASAADASKLSLSNAVGARQGAATKRSSKAVSGVVIGLLAVGVGVGGLAAAGAFDGKNKPTSR